MAVAVNIYCIPRGGKNTENIYLSTLCTSMLRIDVDVLHHDASRCNRCQEARCESGYAGQPHDILLQQPQPAMLSTGSVILRVD